MSLAWHRASRTPSSQDFLGRRAHLHPRNVERMEEHLDVDAAALLAVLKERCFLLRSFPFGSQLLLRLYLWALMRRQRGVEARKPLDD